MGKFSGILLCTDLDETLLDSKKQVSEQNKNAIEYFKQNGGMFTFITGRTPLGIPHIIDMVRPNAPIGCLNGGAIYDAEKNVNIMEKELDRSHVEILEMLDRDFPSAGIEVIAHDKCWFCKSNELVNQHRSVELLPDNRCDYHNVPGKLAKVLIIDEPHVIDKIIPAILAHPKAADFDFVRSTKNYYEILPPDSNKGNLLVQIADILGIDIANTVAVGDNENDISMIKAAGTGYAVANAVEQAKAAADRITVSYNDSAIARIIEDIENSIL